MTHSQAMFSVRFLIYGGRPPDQIHAPFFRGNAPQASLLKTWYTYRELRKSTSRTLLPDRRWQSPLPHRQYFRADRCRKCRTHRLKRGHGSIRCLTLLKHVAEASLSSRMGTCGSVRTWVRKLNTRPTPMIQIIAGTPQMKLLTALLIASIVDNTTFLFLPT